MSRILPLTVVVLLAMVLLGRAGREEPVAAVPPPAAPSGEALVAAPPAAATGRNAPTAAVTDPAARPSTPELDRLVTLASRQRLLREQRYTYIDSLLASTDSVIRRWEDRNGQAFRVALIDTPELPGWRPVLPTIARRAFAAWQEAYPDLRFEVVGDPAEAEITVRWTERFEMDRTGQTDLQFLPNGEVRRAEILLALQMPEGQPLVDDGLAAVATHEVGHALGLPHSGNPRDVMFPNTQTSAISTRDRATLVLLYALAPGSLRLDR